MISFPRLLSELEPCQGEIKSDYDDFVVEEVPLYSPRGDGTHVYVFVEKTGLSTGQAAHDIARSLGVGTRDVGYAGLKDARAVARQWFSIEHVDPDAVRKLTIPRIRILDVKRHGNKLKIGHLRENRFVIRVRGVAPHLIDPLRTGLERLAKEGVPNYFGRQRFGQRGDTWQVGRAIIRRDIDEAIDVLLGRPTDQDTAEIGAARRLFAQGRFDDAASAWPRMFHNERRALRVLARTGGNRKRAFLAIDPHSRGFYVSAYQSYLFNRVVAQRIPAGLGRLQSGDLAWIHQNERVFLVEDASVEQPRADRFEISPTGPLFGYRMSHPTGEPGDTERRIFSDDGLSDASFKSGPIRVKGMRRPLRFRPRDAEINLGADTRGPYLEFRFVLPRGCYATSLLRELLSDDTNLQLEESSADD